MRQMDQDGLRLCSFQASLFEASVDKLISSSEIFARRFMLSSIAIELDNLTFLDYIKTSNEVFDELGKTYMLSSGTIKYNKDIMYWCGYIYRYFAYTFELSSKQIYLMFPIRDLASSYEAYHTMSPSFVIARLLEERRYSLFQDNIELYKKIRKDYFDNLNNNR